MALQDVWQVWGLVLKIVEYRLIEVYNVHNKPFAKI